MNQGIFSFATTALFVALTGCGGSTNDTTRPPMKAPNNDSAPIAAETQLSLDVTLSLVQIAQEQAIDLDADALVGTTLNTERSIIAILDKHGALIYLTSEGGWVGQTEIEATAEFTGIEFVGEGRYVVSMSDSRIMLFDEQTATLDELSQLDFDINAITYNEASDSVVVIDDGSPSRIVSMTLEGETSEVTLASEIVDNSITGLTTVDEWLVMASVDQSNEQTLIITANLEGEIGSAWSIPSSTTSGLIVRDPDPDTLALITTNSGEDLIVTTFETPPKPSVVNGKTLTLIDHVELNFEQPSGIDFSPALGNLYFVTDFGEARRGTIDGTSEKLFDVSGNQGDIEAVVYHEASGQLALMSSDPSSEKDVIVTFDENGQQEPTHIEVAANPNHQFESLDYSPELKAYVAVTATEGQRKVLYTLSSTGTETIELSENYDDFVISGVAITEDGRHLYMVTEEWESEEDEVLNAGYLIKINLENQTEIARYAIARPADEEDGMQGVEEPSDIAIDEANNIIFITSDVDDAELYIYDGI